MIASEAGDAPVAERDFVFDKRNVACRADRNAFSAFDTGVCRVKSLTYLVPIAFVAKV